MGRIQGLAHNAAPTAWQRRLTFVVGAVVVIATRSSSPSAPSRCGRSDGFIPATEAVIVIYDLLIAALLAIHATTIGSRGLLLLASGFFFDALIVIPHALTFPGAFAPLGLLGAGLQTTAWLFIIWHFGLPAAVIGYVFLPREPRPLTAATVCWNAALVVGLAVLLTVIATTYGDSLPALFVDQRGFTPLANYVTGFDFSLSTVALLALLARRKKSVFDLWLTVAMVALVAELAMTTFVITGRFSFGFYTSRLFSVAASTVVLIALLAETVRQDVRLARANLALQLERGRKLTTLDAALGAISHELKQPLGSIVNNAEAAQLILDQPAPNVAQIREIVGDIVDESYRADNIIKNIRDLFRTSREDLRQIDINDIISGVLRGLQGDLRYHNVTSDVNSGGQLAGHRRPQGATPGGRVQPRAQRDRRDAGRFDCRTQAACADRKPRPQRNRLFRARLRSGDRARANGADIRALYHHKEKRHGNGSDDMSDDHRAPRRQAFRCIRRGRRRCAI